MGPEISINHFGSSMLHEMEKQYRTIDFDITFCMSKLNALLKIRSETAEQMRHEYSEVALEYLKNQLDYCNNEIKELLVL